MRTLVAATETAAVLPRRDTMSFVHIGWDASAVLANNYGANNVNIGGLSLFNQVGSLQGSDVAVIQG